MSEDLALKRYPQSAHRLADFAQLLGSKGLERGLIGPNEAPRIWDRHIFNSLAVESLIPLGAEVVDLGSGAGLPGLAVAIVRPDLRVTLVDAQLRRVTFLQEVVDELNLGSRCKVEQGRAPGYWKATNHAWPQVVLARGLARLPELVDMAEPALDRGATLLALKGAAAETEIAEFQQTGRGRNFHVELIQADAGLGSATQVVRVVSTSPRQG